ncbi:phenylalanine--tRNA ligase subunit beta [Candidatus Parabeggiatoa sp. HSG14]|uniref:phenylalanine--tRNA ligase subunit beta n=1 Tax=Candidatus Parabeggiatoa sp. HSG14 TaxID=3055593 RepID=UPI0025A74361|nr:phenylalanine--tRNA ligase subunit beta [Thiotrichales bacterium HSG14]
MKFSENWLREWVNPPISTDELVKQLTMAGLEVDSVESVAISFTKVVVGEIIKVESHPNAQKLSVCQVNIGATNESLNIVCGAPNVHIGMRVPTALVGARLEKTKIKKTKLRGVPSHGMLCSAKELGLAENSEGLMPLPHDAPIGEDVRRYLQLEDVSIELELTPNRGDCLGIEGIAREVGVLTRSQVTIPDCSPVAATISDTFPVEIHDPLACPRYVGRIIKNINAEAPTPLWIQERLRRSGLRSISAVVDITNYVLLELGQPMHAFDFACLSGSIQVRMAKAGESLTLLDEQMVELDEQTLVIADHKQPLAMAGIMGGQSSAVTAATQDIFLESAFFAPKQAAGCARRYGLHTDSSHRFERGVDPQLQHRAIERATALLLNIVGGKPGPVIEVLDETTLPVSPTIKLRASRIQWLLGQSIEHGKVNDILMRLGMTITSNPHLKGTESISSLKEEKEKLIWQVCPPSFRFDIAIESDLIEELARVHGYNNLPSHAPQSRLTMYPQQAVSLEQVQAVLVQRDYQEAMTYSFVDPQLQAKLDSNTHSITLNNSISSDMEVMRTTLWTGLLQALLHNQKRQQSRIRLFETGLRFILSEDKSLQQEKMVAGIVSGSCLPEQWGQQEQSIDFFDVKADVEALLSLASTEKEQNDIFRFTSSTHPALHPGQTTAIYRDDLLVGFLGAVHPSLIQTLELAPPVYLFELRLAPIIQAYPHKFKEVSKYPSIRRDIAVVVSENVSANQLLDCIKQCTPETLTDLQLFDIYQGKGIEPGKKSLAIGLIFQAFSRNLTDSEVDTVIEQVLSTLKQNLEAQLRK